METLHATCVVLDGKGILLRGPPGSGKSDLALRLIDGGATLIADDLVTVLAQDGKVTASFPNAPEHMKGALEVRGLGIVNVPFQEEAQIALCIDLMTTSDERLPECETITIDGQPLRLLRVNAFEASAPARIRAALVRELLAC